MTTRQDVSGVRPQGGYIAKYCPVVAQNDTLQPCEPLPTSLFGERIMAKGREFEAAIFEQLKGLHPGVVHIADGAPVAMETATMAAIEAREPLILGGRLPEDRTGRRAGKPDILVTAAASGYRAVDVKHHYSLASGSPREHDPAAACSKLGAPAYEAATPDPERSARRHEGDALQLAHYQRMLEALDLAAPDGRFAGIIGTEGQVVWYDLDQPIWKTPSSEGKQKLRSSMDRYEFEFDFRLDIIAVAQQHLDEPGVPLLVVPAKNKGCGTCGWWNHCGPQLHQGTGDVTLLPRVGWREREKHRERGVTDQAQLAALDARTARLATAVDLAGALQLTEGLDDAAPLAEVPRLAPRKKQLQTLAREGVTTVGDLHGLHGPTVAYADAGMSGLPKQIDLARAAMGPRPAYRARGVSSIEVPRGDVEVDIDMESTDGCTYLWGALPSGTGTDDGVYRAFVTWEPPSPEAEQAAFLEFWSWFTDVRETAHAAGRTLRAYCYNASAENRELLRLAAAAGVIDEVEAFIGSADWVDLLRVVDRQLVTGSTHGLKVTASLIGYRWPVDDPGGDASMVYHAMATGDGSDAERRDARQWLLDYNRGDVEATRAVRDWLSENAATIPPIESAPVPTT